MMATPAVLHRRWQTPALRLCSLYPPLPRLRRTVSIRAYAKHDRAGCPREDIRSRARCHTAVRRAAARGGARHGLIDVGDRARGRYRLALLAPQYTRASEAAVE